MYDINKIYLGFLCIVTGDNGKQYSESILKRGIFYKNDSNKYIDLADGLEYDGKFYNDDCIGKIKINRKSLLPIIAIFLANKIPYKKEMTKDEMINSFCYDEKLNINNLYFGNLVRIKDEKNKDKYPYEVIKNGLFYYNILNNSFVDLKENIEYRSLNEESLFEFVGFSKGDLAVIAEKSLKEVLMKHNILYKDIMNKNEINNLLKQLDKKNEQEENLEYANGVNVDEYLTMKISICGTTSELTEFLKSINEELKPKLLQKKKIRKW